MGTIYKHLLRPLLFSLDPETVHNLSFQAMNGLKQVKPVLKSLYQVNDERLKRPLWGLDFLNPFGLAGGFDKNARCLDIWDAFGFSLVEIGTVTPKPQTGNPKPRLFRYPKMKAIVNRMGFNNDGADQIGERLKKYHQNRAKKDLIVGISIGKQKETPADRIDQVTADYRYVLETLYPYGDYFAVNVSSPNTKDLRSLQQKDALNELLGGLTRCLDNLAAKENRPSRKPLCVKLAPDLSNDAVGEAVDVLLENKVDGVIATNTTNQTEGLETGGLSGAPLRERSTEVIRLIAQHAEGKLPIIGCGGIFTPQDAIEKLQAGASLLQVYTGFVYNGPSMIHDLSLGVLEWLEKEGLDSISSLNKEQVG